MYEANGLNLSRSEYVALKQFIKMSKHEEVSAWIVYGDDAPTARLLAAKGLITGQQIGDAYRVDRATKLGHDFLRTSSRSAGRTASAPISRPLSAECSA